MPLTELEATTKWEGGREGGRGGEGRGEEENTAVSNVMYM